MKMVVQSGENMEMDYMCERTFHSPSHVVPMCAYRRLFDMGQNK